MFFHVLTNFSYVMIWTDSLRSPSVSSPDVFRWASFVACPTKDRASMGHFNMPSPQGSIFSHFIVTCLFTRKMFLVINGNKKDSLTSNLMIIVLGKTWNFYKTQAWIHLTSNLIMIIGKNVKFVQCLGDWQF